MGGKWVDEVDGPKALDSKVSSASVERVYDAVKAGLRTTNAIADKLIMSVTVVQRALITLEDWPSGPRVKRIRSFPAHQFEVAE